MERKYSSEVKPEDGKVKVAGWAHEIRDIGKLVFIILRDREGTIQVTFKKDELEKELFETGKALGQEDVIEVVGTVKEKEEAPGGREIMPERLEILNKAEDPLPLEVSGKVDSEMATRLDNRFMDLRQPEIHRIFRVRDKVITGLREWFDSEGFIEIHTPIISKGGAEGGATLFPVDYYQNEAFMRQSPQLYKQMLMSAGFDRVYELGPSFRAEKFATSRHVSEFTQWDVELAFIEDHNDVMDVLENSIRFLIKYLKENAAEELKEIGADLEVPEKEFPRIEFEKALQILEEEFDYTPDEEGDLDTRGEKLLGEYFEEKGHQFFFVVGYPGEKFYYMQDREEDDIASRKFDLIYRGQELSSGGQREHRLEALTRKMEEQGVDESNFTFYLESFKFGMPPHGGYGLGLDRLVTKLLGLDNIKEAILFPRDPTRLTP
ncbi:MAG: aspartate--tRNA(Asn) ligase [Candidatus Nanohaloarchaea archaeon]|nr:aspartate--tRNA(Asn) ligase [Candidatus Nanohaloarchaea archaeon]